VKSSRQLGSWKLTLKCQGLVVYPTSVEDVSKAVLFSTANSLHLATVGGGHATSGSSSTHGGLCIDLSKMRIVTVDVEKKTVTAQGGALWEHVDAELAKYGLGAVGGTVNHTGIGGLTLGGGYGYLSPRYGLTIDNLLSVELVLANGKIVTASETENKDLFWAVRGAGAAFGVVTSFTYQAHDQNNDVWGGMLVFPPPLLAEVMAFANTILEGPQGDKVMLVGFGAPPPAHQPVIMAIVFYNGSEEEGKAFYEPLLKLGPLANMTTVMPFSSANSMLNPAMFAGLRRTMKGTQCPPRSTKAS
jgi:FAD/FMN-containing dehydrogenase